MLAQSHRTKSFIFELFKIYRIQRFIFVEFGLIFIAAGLIPVVEKSSPRANILTFSDGFWWAIVTATTTGFGDFYPVTLLGRIIGGILMFSGLILFSTTISLVASFFSYRRMKIDTIRTNIRLESLEEQINNLQSKIDYLIRDNVPARKSQPKSDSPR